MLQFIIGAKQSGKTEKAHSVLKNAVTSGRSAVLIVPKQYTFESDKNILHLLGPKDASEVEVLSFSRLVNNAMSRYGGIKKPIAKEGARVILMSLAIETLTDELTVFHRHKNDFALVTKMLSCVDELKRVGVTSDELYSCSEKITDKTLKGKLSEIALIYSAYDALVSESRFDDADVLSEMAKVLSDTDIFKDKTIVIDGFSEFSFGEMKLIEVMLKQSENVYVTLCTDNLFGDHELSAFASVNKTGRSLIKAAKRLGIEIKEPLVTSLTKNNLPADLMYLHENLFSLSGEAYEGESESLTVMESRDIYSECDAVARKIKSFLRLGEYRCRDIAVVCREGETYEKLIKTSFRKYGIPYFEDKRQPIENQPLISFIKSLLSLSADGFQSDTVFRYVKTGLAGFTEEEIALCENYVFAWDIDGKKWLTEWTASPEGFGGEISEKAKADLASINNLREKITSDVVSFRESVKDGTGKEITEKLYHFLRETKADELLRNYALTLEADGFLELALEQEQVWDVLMDVFDEIAGVLTEKQVSLKRYLEIFELIISSKSLGKLPDGFDEVYVSTADRMMTKHARVVFAVGMNMGVFPLQQPSAGLLSIREKERMDEAGVSAGDSVRDFISKERFLLYSTLFSAKEKLLVSYVTTSQSGETIKENEWVRSIRRLLPYHKEITPLEESIESLVESESAAFELMAKKWNENSPKAEALRQYFRGKEEYRTRLEAIERATDENEFEIKDSKKAVKLFGRDMNFSASQMEVYYRCPFMYFCKYGVYAKQRLKARLDALESGTVIHHCLETILGNHKGREFLSLTDEELREEIKVCLKEYIDRNMGGSEDKTERFNYLYMRTDKIIRHIMDRLSAEFSQSDFEMCDFELKIDKHGKIEPIELKLKEGSVRIKGSVDRVDKLDLDGKRYIRVIDYKSGAKEFVLSDVLYGLNLQMVLYLVSIVRSKNSFYKDSVPAGVLYFPANIKPVSSVRDDSEENRRKKIYSVSKMNGMLVGDEAVIECMDKEKQGLFLPASFDAKGTVKGNFISLSQFSRLSEYIDRLIREMGEGVHDGKIPAKPALGPSHSTTCEWCDYSEVCLREKGDYRYIEKMKHDDALRKISGGEDDEA